MRIGKLTAIAVLCAAGLTNAHDDLVGTRYVALNGTDEGSCESRDLPCRSLGYATSVARQGDAIKVASGSYDVARFDIESLFFGKQGLRGGYTTDDHFHAQEPLANPTYVIGADESYVAKLLAHGFTPLGPDGQPMQREAVQTQPPANCVNGMAGQFPCWNVDFLAQIPLTGFSSQPFSAANLWGFVHECISGNREYAVVGLNNGTGVVDVTDPANPVEIDVVPGVTSAWREVKILQVDDPSRDCDRAYAYLSTEGPGGLQVLDLSDLPASVTLANTISDYSTSHTLYISNVDYSTNKALPGRTPFLYVAGARNQLGAMNGEFRIYDLSNPTSPQFVTSNPGVAGLPETRGFYMHDSTTVLVSDARRSRCAGVPDTCEVLVDFNEQSVDLWDVTNATQPRFLSRTTFPNARYIHSGWPTSDQRHVIVHDELDELQIPGLRTSIYTLDISDLAAPTIVTSYTGPDTTTDHNGYAVADRYFVSHYKRGLVIFDVANPLALREVAYFDTFLQPCENSADTDGAWGVYPFLPSGTILVSDIENGLFVLRRNETSSARPQAQSCSQPRSSGGSGAMSSGWLLIFVGIAAIACWRRLPFRPCVAIRSPRAPARPGGGSRRHSRKWRAASAAPATT